MSNHLRITGSFIGLAIFLLSISCNSPIVNNPVVANFTQPFDVSVWSFATSKSSDPMVNNLTFRIGLKPNSRTSKNANYVVSLTDNGKTVDSKNVSVPAFEQWSKETGFKTEEQFNNIWRKDVDLVLKYPIQDKNSTGMRFLADLDSKCRSTQDAFNEFQAKFSWDLARGAVGGKSYEEMKSLQAQEQKLRNEVQEWNALRSGGNMNTSPSWLSDSTTFCTKYVGVTVTTDTSKPK